MRLASRACSQLSHRQAQAIRSVQHQRMKDRLNAVVAFDRDCDDLFGRIRQAYVQANKKAKQVAESVAKQRRIQSETLRDLKSSGIDLKKASVQYDLQKRKANDSGDEDRLMIQRLIDTLFEQRAQVRHMRRQLRRHPMRHKSDGHVDVVSDTIETRKRPSLRKLLLHQNKVLNNEYQRHAVVLFSAEHRAEQLVKKLRKHEQRWSDLNMERQCRLSERRSQARQIWTTILASDRLFDALRYVQDYEKCSESLYQALFSVLQCGSCHDVLRDPVLTSQCQHVQCRQCLVGCQSKQVCSSCNALRSSKLFVSLNSDLGPVIQAVHDLRPILRTLGRDTREMANRLENPRVADSIESSPE